MTLVSQGFTELKPVNLRVTHAVKGQSEPAIGKGQWTGRQLHALKIKRTLKREI